ncbi:MAG: hypothetical protein AAB212_08490, partial [Bacteroidota bacterium]
MEEYTYGNTCYTAWPALTFISLFIITALTISTLLINHPGKHSTQLVGSSNKNTASVNQSKAAVVASTMAGDNYFQH